MSLVRNHPLYRRWAWMRQVCYNPNSPDYPSHGGKGISIGHEFAEFWDFAHLIETKLGLPPNGFHSKLARKDQSGDYTIKNVRWEDSTFVGRHAPNVIFLTYKNKTMPLKDWSEIIGINFHTMLNRMNRGWTPAQVLGYRPGPHEMELAKKRKARK
jgi:hypothetical protein